MANQLFGKSKSTRCIDDTLPLFCTVESAEKAEDHIEYTLRIHRGLMTETGWQLRKRYTDFVSLDAELKIANIELPLPAKRVFGNFNRDFVAERKKGLQNYMNALLSKPILYNSLPVKQFLDPVNYSLNFTEISLQHVSMILRSEKTWEVIETLPDIGWRLRKTYIQIKPVDQPKVRLMLSWCDYGPYKYLPDKELTALMKVLQSIQHPNIQTLLLSTANENGGLVIRPFFEKGTLRDLICKCKPKIPYLKKYGNSKLRTDFDVTVIKTVGRQILETLNCLHDKGLPYCHLHAGNVLLEGRNAYLLDIENWLLGVPSYYRNFVVQFKKIKTTELFDVYCFGQLLYEMTFGQELETESCDNFPPSCPAELRSVLESILTTEACKNGLPSVQDLLLHPLFSDVVMSPTDKPQVKIPSKLKEALKAAKEEFEKQLREEQKLVVNFPLPTSTGALVPPAPSSVPSGASPAPPPPPPPPPPAAPPLPPPGNSALPPPPPPVSGERGALLSSIANFRKGGLKKTETIDKSAPKI
ncbi:hypothetical protein ACJMK2_016222 [Sinanodonta woodiana]|uniref:PX domain-containing protein kinase-like protein n=1 Tax=Sinanodonta woodiana TaxID=1069815 RepID=A0ABD3UWL8_SINWO